MLVSDQDRWLTYAEAGTLLGISAQAARMLAKRRGWARRTPNAYGDRAQVLVPVDAIVQPRSASLGVRTESMIANDQPHANGHDQANVRVLEQAIELLRDQLGTANRRADDDRTRADQVEQKVAALLVELTELRISAQAAVNQAKYATDEAIDLRKRLDVAEQRAGEERARADRERECGAEAEQQADRAERRIEELQTALAAAQERITALLTDQRSAAPPPPVRRSWWRWGRQ